MKIFNNQKLVINILEKQGINYFHEVWSGFIRSEDFRNLLSRSIELYKANVDKVKKHDHNLLLLADASKMELVKNDDMEWLANNINPLYEECGFTHQAVVMPERFFGQQSVKNYEELSKSGKMLTNVFHTENEALKWFIQNTKVSV